MAIKRLQIPEGAPIWGPTKPQTLAVKLLKERPADISILEPGDYDVTPEPSKDKYPNSNQLTVMEDGTALYRIFNLGRAAITKINHAELGSINTLPEGRGALTHLPQDSHAQLVIGDRLGRSNRGILFLFDVIVWSRGNVTNNELHAVTAVGLSLDLASANG